jgi:hypothetical protein
LVLNWSTTSLPTVLPRIQLSVYYSNSSAKVIKCFGLLNILNWKLEQYSRELFSVAWLKITSNLKIVQSHPDWRYINLRKTCEGPHHNKACLKATWYQAALLFIPATIGTDFLRIFLCGNLNENVNFTEACFRIWSKARSKKIFCIKLF